MTLKLLFDPISHPERAQGDSGEKKLIFNRKEPLAEPDSGSWGWRGQERGINKHRNARPGITAEKESILWNVTLR